jgi:hypothetical protein
MSGATRPAASTSPTALLNIPVAGVGHVFCSDYFFYHTVELVDARSLAFLSAVNRTWRQRLSDSSIDLLWRRHIQKRSLPFVREATPTSSWKACYIEYARAVLLFRNCAEHLTGESEILKKTLLDESQENGNWNLLFGLWKGVMSTRLLEDADAVYLGREKNKSKRMEHLKEAVLSEIRSVRVSRELENYAFLKLRFDGIVEDFHGAPYFHTHHQDLDHMGTFACQTLKGLKIWSENEKPTPKTSTFIIFAAGAAALSAIAYWFFTLKQRC